MASHGCGRFLRAAGAVAAVTMLLGISLAGGATAQSVGAGQKSVPGPPAGAPGSYTNPLTPPSTGTIQPLDSGCASGNVCFWPLQNKQGEKRIYGNAWAGNWWYVSPAHNFYHSLWNNFSDRAVLTGVGSGSNTCTFATQDRNQPPAFDRFYIKNQNTCP